MTLRFFRRKSAAKGTKSEADAGSGVTESRASTSSRSRGRGSSNRSEDEAPKSSDKQAKTPAVKRPTSSSGNTASSRSKRTAKAATTKDEAPATEDGSASPAKSSRARRGRRGGARRNKTSAPAAEAPPERASATTPPSDGATIESLLLRQEAVVEQQVAALKGLQGSLSAIENRLGGMGGAGARTASPRVGIFVDVPNVIYAAERQKVKLDYRKLLDFLVRDRELVRASAYSPISDDPQLKLETQRFVQPFDDIGYRVITKPHKRYADGSMKANFDVELAIDVLTMADRLDIVTLVSGDGDFRRLVELVGGKGVRVEVVAFSQSTAAELRAVADEYINLNDHLDTLRLD